MEPILMILVFIKWLEENPAIFLPSSWKHLPSLKQELEHLDYEDFFPIAHTIGKWCAKHDLGDRLSKDTDWMEVTDPLDDNSKFPDRMPDPIEHLHQAIEDRYHTFESKFH